MAMKPTSPINFILSLVFVIVGLTIYLMGGGGRDGNTHLAGLTTIDNGAIGISHLRRGLNQAILTLSLSILTAANGRIRDALRLFETMPEPNVVSWNTLVTGYLEIGDVMKVIEMFERMPVRDSASLSVLVSGLIWNSWVDEAERVLLSTSRGNGIFGAVYAYNTLIVGFGRCGRVADARRLFDMILRGCMNVVSSNSMIMCYVKAKEIKLVRGLFDEMSERDDVSWNTMIAGYVQMMEMGSAELLYRELCDPDVRSWNSMICGFTQKGELDRAREFFEKMPLKTLVSWNTMIAGYEKNGECEGAIEAFTQMQSANVRPDRHTLSSVLSACVGLTTLHQGTQIHLIVA